MYDSFGGELAEIYTAFTPDQQRAVDHFLHTTAIRLIAARPAGELPDRDKPWKAGTVAGPWSSLKEWSRSRPSLGVLIFLFGFSARFWVRRVEALGSRIGPWVDRVAAGGP
jgi:hypothetical protein